MSEYLTIKQACELTGKSDKTIRRNIINVQESLNKGRQIKAVSKQGSKYLILKNYLIEFYKLDTNLVMPSQMTKKQPKKTKKKDSYLDKYIDKLEKENTDLKRVRDTLLDTNKELTRQNDQSQRLIAQLQKTNTTLLLGEREKKINVEPKKESAIWIVISLIVIVAVAYGGYYVFYKLG